MLENTPVYLILLVGFTIFKDCYKIQFLTPPSISQTPQRPWETNSLTKVYLQRKKKSDTFLRETVLMEVLLLLLLLYMFLMHVRIALDQVLLVMELYIYLFLKIVDSFYALIKAMVLLPILMLLLL